MASNSAQGNPGAGQSRPPAPARVDPQVRQWFNAVDVNKSGRITAKELQNALVNAEGKNFNMEICQYLIKMFGSKTRGVVNIYEFQDLYNFVNEWIQAFRSYDKDQSGLIEEEEVSLAFQQMGYKFSPQFIKFLIARADKVDKKKMSIDQFMLVVIQIQKFTEERENLEEDSD